MNLILFQPEENPDFLPANDPRAIHVKEVLRMQISDTLYIGVLNGRRGLAKIVREDETGIGFGIKWEDKAFSFLPIHLLVGLPRPQTARKILSECTTLGVKSISFFKADKGEPNYIHSKLWQTDEWKRILVRGAEQAFVTIVPEVLHFESLEGALCSYKSDTNIIALDNYEAREHFKAYSEGSGDVVVVLGPESGFSAEERKVLRDKNVPLYHLGERVLRCETACVAAIGLLIGKA